MPTLRLGKILNTIFFDADMKNLALVWEERYTKRYTNEQFGLRTAWNSTALHKSDWS